MASHQPGCECGPRSDACAMSPAHPVFNAVMNGDPTRTTALRQSFIRDVNRRFKKLMALITDAVANKDVFGLRESTVVGLAESGLPSGAFAFDRSDQKVQKFMQWLRRKEKEGILEITTRTGISGVREEPWTNTYIRSSYQKGIAQGRSKLIKSGIQSSIADIGTPEDSIQAAFNQPYHADRVGLLYTRAFSDLEGITAAMDTKISRILTQGMAEGRNPNELARLLNQEVKSIGMVRARTLARTEVIRAHHVANINEFRAAGVEGVMVKAEWSTAGDFRVCQRCRNLEGKVFNLDEIEPMIPLHPNCRCTAIPVIQE